MFYYIVLTVCLLLLSSCKEEEDKVEIEESQLFTLNHGGYRTRLASDDWSGMNYGFDAVSDAGDAYVSVENNIKSNTFLLLAAENSIDRYRIVPGASTALSRSSMFEIPDPSNPNLYIWAVRYTLTSGSITGSEELVLERKLQSMQDGTWHWIDLMTLKDEDAVLWGYNTPGIFDNPITLFAKIYPPRDLPPIKIQRLYGSTEDLAGLEDYTAKIVSQAVCYVPEFAIQNDWTPPDKPWDLNGNGKLDVWPNDKTNPGNEFPGFKQWAKDNGIWSDIEIGAAVLEQEFEVHDNGGVPVFGMAEENCIALPKHPDDIDIKRSFSHECLHCALINPKGDGIIGLHDVTDEFNLMYYTSDLNQKWLRYRPVTLEEGGTEKQWDILSEQIF